jgi:hypothetical protein
MRISIPSGRLVAVVAAGVVLVVGLLVWQTNRGPDGGSLTLPTTFLGRTQDVGAFEIEPTWQQSVEGVVGDAAYAGAQYGLRQNRAGGPGPVINVTVARADLSGRLDEGMAGGAIERLGEVECTNSIKLGSGAAASRPGHALCWRNSAHLSVIALSFSRAPELTALAAATESLWQDLH